MDSDKSRIFPQTFGYFGLIFQNRNSNFCYLPTESITIFQKRINEHNHVEYHTLALVCEYFLEHEEWNKGTFSLNKSSSSPFKYKSILADKFDIGSMVYAKLENGFILHLEV